MTTDANTTETVEAPEVVEESQAETSEVNIFDMSDEEVMEMNESDFLGSQEQEVEASVEEEPQEEEISEEEESLEEEEELPEEEESLEEEEPSEEEESIEGEETLSTDAVEMKKQLDLLFAPFKANGRTMQVESVDEAITLMQMGANYNKKMAGLKPAFKVAKMLENNKLLDENTVSYLIDLHKGDKEAINKLIQDTKFNVDDYDGEQANKYAPTNQHTVTDNELALDEVLEQIRDTDTYQATMTVVGEEWDDSSKSKLVANPRMIASLNEHMSNGIYDKITTEVNRRQALNQLVGMSNLDAYFTVGNELMQAGAFEAKSEEKATKTEDPLAVAAQEAKKQKRESQRKASKQAAKQPKASVKKKVKQEFNPFEMDDDEFMKLAGNGLPM